jgi:hypothetical protein
MAKPFAMAALANPDPGTIRVVTQQHRQALW